MLTDGFEIAFSFATHTGVNSGIWDGRGHVVTFIVDGGPRVASVVVDERLDDGGETAVRVGLFIRGAWAKLAAPACGWHRSLAGLFPVLWSRTGRFSPPKRLLQHAHFHHNKLMLQPTASHAA